MNVTLIRTDSHCVFLNACDDLVISWLKVLEPKGRQNGQNMALYGTVPSF